MVTVCKVSKVPKVLKTLTPQSTPTRFFKFYYFIDSGIPKNE